MRRGLSARSHMPGDRRPNRAQVRVAVLDSALLAAACALTWWLVVRGLAAVHSVSHADDRLGALWAVVSTVFVCRFSYHESMKAALSRVAATFVSFSLCLVYLIFLPFHIW